MKRLLGLVVLVWACGGTTASASPTQVRTSPPAPTPSPVYDALDELPIGQCFDPLRDKDDDFILAARLRSCDEPHLAEVIGHPRLPDAAGAEYPGDEELGEAAESECRTAFSDYVGIDYDSSNLQAEFSYPSSDTWSTGDRVVVCMVTGTETAPLTRSVMGSRQ
jgi:hypothetical protein